MMLLVGTVDSVDQIFVHGHQTFGEKFYTDIPKP